MSVNALTVSHAFYLTDVYVEAPVPRRHTFEATVYGPDRKRKARRSSDCCLPLHVRGVAHALGNHWHCALA